MAGTISASGLCTAPAAAGPATVTVVATSIADPGRSGTVTVTRPNPAPTLFGLGKYSVLSGKAVVPVYTPPVGGDTTIGHSFPIENRVPVLTSLSHRGAIARTSATTVTVNRSNFEAQATVRCNGVDRSTTRLGPTQRKVEIPVCGLLGVSNNTITVDNPATGARSAAGIARLGGGQ